MKLAIKHQLAKIGIWSQYDLARQLKQIAHWINTGCSGNAPHPVKRMVLSSYLKRFNLTQFIETGTYLGDTLAYIAHHKSVRCISIELADIFYQLALQRFTNYSNVKLIQGDSGMVLPDVVQTMNSPALFWLDGHYSGGNTGRGDSDTPVIAELQAILNSSIKNHVILIDDARCFDGTNSYPYLDAVIKMIRENGAYNIEVSADIIRLTPRSCS